MVLCISCVCHLLVEGVHGISALHLYASSAIRRHPLLSVALYCPLSFIHLSSVLTVFQRPGYHSSPIKSSLVNMYYSPALVLLPFAFAAPLERRALTLQSYNDLSISAGTAGNAQAEALAKFPVDMSNLAGVSAADLKTIQTERESAESAESDAFNPAIDAATGDAATALQNGKIKNKVLKCMLSRAFVVTTPRKARLTCDASSDWRGPCTSNPAGTRKGYGGRHCS